MSKKVVVAGSIKSGSTDYKIDNLFGEGTPAWRPQREPKRFPETDHDLIRKQRIEDAAARGEGL